MSKTNLQKLHATRAGIRANISMLIESAENAKIETDVEEFRLALEELEITTKTLLELNEKILSATDAEHTEEEIVTTGADSFRLKKKLSGLRSFRNELDAKDANKNRNAQDERCGDGFERQTVRDGTNSVRGEVSGDESSAAGIQCEGTRTGNTSVDIASGLQQQRMVNSGSGTQHATAPSTIHGQSSQKSTDEAVNVDNFINSTEISDLSVADTMTVMETETNDRDDVTSGPIVNEKCQIRRCWSDIWPFPNDFGNKITVPESNSGDDIVYGNIGGRKSKERITPFYPLPSNSAPPIDEAKEEKPDQSRSSVSVSSEKEPVVLSSTEVNVELEAVSGSAINVEVSDSRESVRESTMTATVIVPQRDRTCTQWITFSGDNEPILNNSPAVDEGCNNTFLKRLQRSKLYSNSDPSLPANSQFCFEAVVDKRYNRWKRRRRKKKEAEYRRSSVPPASDSSDENDDFNGRRNKDIEKIIDRMYERINGCPPQTPGGSSDTPRMRNRRRRTDNEGDKKGDNYAFNYDASSEWTIRD